MVSAPFLLRRHVFHENKIRITPMTIMEWSDFIMFIGKSLPHNFVIGLVMFGRPRGLVILGNTDGVRVTSPREMLRRNTYRSSDN